MKKYMINIMFIFLSIININTANANEVKVRKFIENMADNSREILNNSKISEKERQKEYVNFTETVVDINWVSRFILGRNWRNINDQQKAEFQSLYKEYLLQNYIPKLKDYNKDIVVEKINKKRKNVYMVSTKTKDATGRVINVDFRIVEKNNQLSITDIIPEGISFIGNQRTDVNNSIDQNGFDEFIKQLKSKIDN